MKTKYIVLGMILVLTLTLSAGTYTLAETRVKGIDERYEMIIDDEADLLTAEEEERLLDRMRPLTEFGTVVFYTPLYPTGGTESEARRCLSRYVSSNKSFSCAVFMIDLKNRQLWIECRGMMRDSIGISDSYTITGNVANKATAKQYFACADEAFRQMNVIVMGERVFSPMRYLCCLLIALALALLIAYRMVRGTMQSSVSAKKNANHANYDIHVDVVSSKLIREKKTARPRSSSGSSCSSCSSGSSCSSCSSGSSCSSCGGGGGSGF